MSKLMDKPYPIHPLAELLPPMTQAEYEALRDQVAAVGRFTDAATLLDGKLLDGRHRQRIAFELKLPLPTKEFDPKFGSPADFVYAKALHRNLTDSQKAAAAVRVKQAMGESAKARQLKGLKQFAESPSRTGSTTEGVDGRSREKAGELFGVSGRYVQEAEAIFKADRKLFDRVFAGELKVSQAKRALHRATKRAAHRSKAAALPATVRPEDHYALHVGDCLVVMPTLPRRHARLVVADPPYNEGLDYGEGAKADLLPREQYLKWTAAWMVEASELLAADGALWVIINDEWADAVSMLGREIGLHRRAWVKWYETFGVNCLNNFNRTSRHLFYFVKDKARFVFNADAVNRPSARQTDYGDKRAHPGGKIWDDVWGIHPKIPRIVGNSAERLPDFKTQLPEDLIRPIVGACSEPGDTVVDPFNGSGTTGAVCVRLGRRYEGIDKNAARVKQSDQRLRGVLAEKFAGAAPAVAGAGVDWVARMRACKTADEGRELFTAHEAAINRMQRQSGLTPTCGKISEHYTKGFSVVTKREWQKAISEAKATSPAVADRLRSLVDQGNEIHGEMWSKLYAGSFGRKS